MNLIRKINVIKTPTCAKCKHCRIGITTGHFYCNVPSYLEFIEKTRCKRTREVDALNVRGTKYCKFESKEQQ